MSSTNGSEPVGPDPRTVPNLKHPEVLVAEIERTREDLAQTLDAIVDRVSPKRVADRTRKKVAEAVAVARENLVAQAGVARQRATVAVAEAKDRAAVVTADAKDRAAVVTAEAKDRAAVVTASAKDRVSGSSGSHAAVHGGSVAVPADLPSADGAHADGPPTSPAHASAGPKPEVLAGGALGLLVLLLLRRRRTKRKAQRTGAVAALAVAGAELRSDFEKGRRKGRKQARKSR